MAEAQDQLQEPTEKPTPKRLRDAREKGEVVRSRELTTLAVTLTAAASLLVLGGPMVRSLSTLMIEAFSRSRAELLSTDSLMTALHGATREALILLGPYFALLMIAASLSPLALGGWSFSPGALAFKPKRLNPISGLKRIFALRGLMEMLKAMAKFALVGAVAVALLRTIAPELMSLGREPIVQGMNHAAQLSALSFLVLICALIVVAAVDVPFQLWDHAKKLRMTRQDVKEESKETEGRPEVRNRMRTLQQEIGRQRMMGEVPKATVVITNPTHYSVALRYDHEETNAPIVVAKGIDHLARRIREVAEEHRVPIFESAPVARTLYASTPIGGEIPANLYVAVAQVLTYVYQLRNVDEVGGPMPTPPEPRIDEDPL